MHFSRPLHAEETVLDVVGLLLLSLLFATAGCDTNGTDPPPPEALVPPADVSADALPGVERVSLSWSPVGSAVSYNVYRATSAGEATDGSPLEDGVTETNFTDTTVAFDTEYYYRISSVGSQGNESAPSEEVSTTVRDSVPGN